MVARTINETLNVVEHTPPVHKKVRWVLPCTAMCRRRVPPAPLRAAASAASAMSSPTPMHVTGGRPFTFPCA